MSTALWIFKLNTPVGKQLPGQETKHCQYSTCAPCALCWSLPSQRQPPTPRVSFVCVLCVNRIIQYKSFVSGLFHILLCLREYSLSLHVVMNPSSSSIFRILLCESPFYPSWSFRSFLLVHKWTYFLLGIYVGVELLNCRVSNGKLC